MASWASWEVRYPEPGLGAEVYGALARGGRGQAIAVLAGARGRELDLVGAVLLTLAGRRAEALVLVESALGIDLDIEEPAVIAWLEANLLELAPRHVLVDPTGRLVVAFSEQGYTLLDAMTVHVRGGERYIGRRPRFAHFSADGSQRWIAGDLVDRFGAHGSFVDADAVGERTPGHRYTYAGAHKNLAFGRDGTLLLKRGPAHELVTGSTRRPVDLYLAGNAAAFDATGRYLAIGEDDDVSIIDVTSARPFRCGRVDDISAWFVVITGGHVFAVNGGGRARLAALPPPD